MVRLQCTLEKNYEDMTPEEREVIDRLKAAVQQERVNILVRKFAKTAGLQAVTK